MRVAKSVAAIADAPCELTITGEWSGGAEKPAWPMIGRAGKVPQRSP
ncbi:hypothetical protein MKK75_12040 [Methylobacterium sp. J-030]|nr:hypothetical protein [Methylobacterium sp. J-030]